MNRRIKILISRYPALEKCAEDIMSAYYILEDSYKHGGKLLIAGNGGSAADAEHIVGELMKGFKKTRPLSDEMKKKICSIDNNLGDILSDNLQEALPAIALDGHPALTTAYMNDVEPQLIFAQQVNGYGNDKDVFLGISTSGNSKNILYAAITAKAMGMSVVGLTGVEGGAMKRYADVNIQVPESETYKVQELHLPIYHCLCLMLEDSFF